MHFTNLRLLCFNLMQFSIKDLRYTDSHITLEGWKVTINSGFPTDNGSPGIFPPLYSVHHSLPTLIFTLTEFKKGRSVYLLETMAILLIKIILVFFNFIICTSRYVLMYNSLL